MRRQVKIGLALGSGGARGLAHLGVLARLNEWGVKLHCVAGTSIGAIMGAIYASGTVDKAIAWAERLDWAGAATLFAEINMPVTGFFTGRRVEERLRKFIPYGDFSESPVPLATVATDIATGEEVVLRTDDHVDEALVKYSRELYGSVEDEELRCVLAKVLGMGFDEILTTNYDYALEGTAIYPKKVTDGWLRKSMKHTGEVARAENTYLLHTYQEAAMDGAADGGAGCAAHAARERANGRGGDRP